MIKLIIMIKPDKIKLTNRKNISIKIDRQGKLIVTAPKDADLNRVFSFIKEKEKWILEKQGIITNTLNFNNDLVNYEQILFFGNRYPVIYIKNQSEICLTETNLCAPLNIGFSRERIVRNLRNWFIENAEVILIKRVKELAKYSNLSYKSISIINSKAKWGMCDSNKNIYFNYKLLMLPHNLIDYVIFHELVHLIELNHSKNFYEELNRRLPNYKKCQEELKKCGFLLNLFV